MNRSSRLVLARLACACALIVLTGITGLVACSDANGPSGSSQALVYQEASPTAGVSRVVRVLADGSGRTVLYEGAEWELSPLSVAPDGRILLRTGEGWLLLPAGGGAAVPFTLPDVPDPRNPVWSPDGASIAWSYTTGTGHALAVAAPGSSALLMVIADSLEPFSVDWSPDGARLVFSASNLERGTNNLYTANRNGSDLRKLTADSLYASSPPAWSRSGSQIAFVRDGNLWSITPGGSGLRQVSSGGAAGETDGWAGPLFWSRDDRNLLATSGGSRTLYSVRVVNGAQSPLRVPGPAEHIPPRTANPLSPDGSRVLYPGQTPTDANDSYRPAVFVALADGTGGIQVSPDTVTSVYPVWLPASD